MFDEKSWYSKYVKTLLKRSNNKEEKDISDAEFEFVEEHEHDQEDETLHNQSKNLLHHNSWLFESRDSLPDDTFKTLDDSLESESELLLGEKKKKEPLCTKEKCLDYTKNWNSFRRKVPYYIPIFDWLPKYKFSEFFLSDLLAGLTVASVVIPQGIAYSTLANVAPVVGLYTAWMPMITYTLLGTSRQLAIGPEGVVSLLVGTAVTVVPISQSDDFYAVTYTRATLLALMCGIITFILGILRVGFLDNLISRPILHGFVSASAAVIFVGQLDKLLGFSVEQQEWEKIIGVIENINEINWVSTAIGISSILFIVILDLSKKKVGGLARFIPTSLLVVVIMTVLSWAFDFAGKYGVVVLDVVEGGFPNVAIPPIWDLNLVKELSIQAILISIVGFVESNAIGKTYATINGYEISANRELVAFGNSNIVSSCFGAFPAFGSLSRSGIANTAGSKTQLYGFWGSILVLLCILFLMPLFQDLPKSAIAGIVMVAAARLIEFHWMELWQLRAFLEIFLTLFTFITTFFLGAQLGIVLALGISVFLVVKHTTLPNISVLGRNSEGKWVDINDNPSALTFRGLIVIRLEESLYFGNIEQIVKLIRRIVTLGSCNMHPTSPSLHSDKIEYVIIDGRNIHTMDANSVTVLKEMTLDYNKKGITVFFTHLKEKHVELMHRAKLSDLCEGRVVQSSINRALSVTKQLRVHSANESYNDIVVENYEGNHKKDNPDRIIINNKDDHPEHSAEYIELENKGSDSEREDDIYRGIKDPVDPNYFSNTNL